MLFRGPSPYLPAKAGERAESPTPTWSREEKAIAGGIQNLNYHLSK